MFHNFFRAGSSVGIWAQPPAFSVLYFLEPLAKRILSYISSVGGPQSRSGRQKGGWRTHPCTYVVWLWGFAAASKHFLWCSQQGGPPQVLSCNSCNLLTLWKLMAHLIINVSFPLPSLLLPFWQHLITWIQTPPTWIHTATSVFLTEPWLYTGLNSFFFFF